jgi:hypothetical protein
LSVAQAVHVLALSLEYVFVAQTDVPVHAVLLEVILQPVVYVPAVAFVQLVLPVEPWYVPAGHAVCLSDSALGT